MPKFVVTFPAWEITVYADTAEEAMKAAGEMYGTEPLSAARKSGMTYEEYQKLRDSKPMTYDPKADDKYSDLELGDSRIRGYI